MEWDEVLAKGWTCGGSSSSSCTCSAGSAQDSCNQGGKEYYHCKSKSPNQCMEWSEVVAKGWSCGGQLTSDCTCGDGQHQGSCTYDGQSHYHCKTKHEPAAPPPPSDAGKAKTDGCSCTEPCRAEGWCNADCFEYGWDNCISSDGEAPAPAPGGSDGEAGSAGQFIAAWTKKQFGKLVPSEMQGSTQCWDLAMRALEEAAKAGFRVEHTGLKSGQSYKWSATTVHWEDAQPGDIMQFRGWRQKYRWAGNPHTAIVIEAPKGDKCVITAYDQNPDPVHESPYDTCAKISGEVTIYRVGKSPSRLRLFSVDGGWRVDGPLASRTSAWLLLASLAAATATALSVLGRRRRAEPRRAELAALAPSAGEGEAE